MSYYIWATLLIFWLHELQTSDILPKRKGQHLHNQTNIDWNEKGLSVSIVMFDCLCSMHTGTLSSMHYCHQEAASVKVIPVAHGSWVFVAYFMMTKIFSGKKKERIEANCLTGKSYQGVNPRKYVNLSQMSRSGFVCWF